MHDPTDTPPAAGAPAASAGEAPVAPAQEPAASGPPAVRYALDPQQPLAAELERVAREQLALAQWDLGQALVRPSGDPSNIAVEVHDVRKGLKKLRALLRLLRGAIGRAAFRRHNVLLRDAARRLSGGRDAQVLLERFEELSSDGPTPSAVQALAPVGRQMALRAAELGEQLRRDGHLAGVASSLEQAARSLDEQFPLKIGLRGLLDDLARVYGRSRAAMRCAGRKRTDERFHEWRKSVKYVRHHLELLQPAAHELLGATEQLFHDLADLLGENNDLAVLGRELRLALDAQARDGAQAVALQELLELSAQRQQKLQDRALELGRQLHAEKPRAYAWRLRKYWRKELRIKN
jgi:CHAD domain-containing protein